MVCVGDNHKFWQVLTFNLNASSALLPLKYKTMAGFTTSFMGWWNEVKTTLRWFHMSLTWNNGMTTITTQYDDIPLFAVIMSTTDSTTIYSTSSSLSVGLLIPKLLKPNLPNNDPMLQCVWIHLCIFICWRERRKLMKKQQIMITLDTSCHNMHTSFHLKLKSIGLDFIWYLMYNVVGSGSLFQVFFWSESDWSEKATFTFAQLKSVSCSRLSIPNPICILSSYYKAKLH